MSRFRASGTWPPGQGAPRWTTPSGKRKGKAKSKKGNRYLGGPLGETAIAAGKTKTREGARYRRLARRRGEAKALVAVGNTQLKVYHKLLSSPGMRYEDLGPDYYERRAEIAGRSATTSASSAPSASTSPSAASPNPGRAGQETPKPPDP